VTVPFATPTETETATESDADRWRAVEARDGSARTAFVYAVVSTGVFCRPGCPSRLPRRENVVFFHTPDQARSAGYQPCRRCRPDEGGAHQVAGHDAAMACARHRLETETPAPGLTELATEAGLSPGHFQRVFKARVGLSPKQYARACRAQRLRAALEAGETVTDAIYQAGYSGPARAHADAAGVLGMPASRFRQGGAGEVIDHATVPCMLGVVLVAATGRGICAVQPGDPGCEAALLESLRARFPRATLRADGPAARSVVPVVLRLIEQPNADAGAGLALDLDGTAFQLRVWQALRHIPPGETRTYADVAAAIGRPSAARAVANACGSNPAAIVVPCHRVVRGDGGLGGYRWGLERKRRLLESEQG